MGGGLSHFAGAGTIKRLVSSAGLPLEVDDDISHDQLQDPGKVKQIKLGLLHCLFDSVCTQTHMCRHLRSALTPRLTMLQDFSLESGPQ